MEIILSTQMPKLSTAENMLSTFNNKSHAVTRKLHDAACFSYVKITLSCYMLQLMKDQGRFSTGSHY